MSNNMLAVDWSHTRNYAVYDGKTAEVLPLNELLDRAKKASTLLIEAGAPSSVLYKLCKVKPTYLIDAHKVAEERKNRGLSKHKSGVEDDLVDAKIIYSLARNGHLKEEATACTKLKSNMRLPLASFISGPITISDERLRLVNLYHQYLYIARAWLKTQQVKKAMQRHFGKEENDSLLLSLQHEKDYKKRIESLKKEIISLVPEAPISIRTIKGMGGKWLWACLVVSADPRLFPNKSTYRKYLGLINHKTINHRYSRDARRVYWLVVDQLYRHRTSVWRKMYDEYKAELTSRDGYTHPHSGALNRVATKFANFVWEQVNNGQVQT